MYPFMSHTSVRIGWSAASAFSPWRPAVRKEEARRELALKPGRDVSMEDKLIEGSAPLYLGEIGRKLNPSLTLQQGTTKGIEDIGRKVDQVEEIISERSNNVFVSLGTHCPPDNSFGLLHDASVDRWSKDDQTIPFKKRKVSPCQSEEGEQEEGSPRVSLKKRRVSTYQYEEKEKENSAYPLKKRKEVFLTQSWGGKEVNNEPGKEMMYENEKPFTTIDMSSCRFHQLFLLAEAGNDQVNSMMEMQAIAIQNALTDATISTKSKEISIDGGDDKQKPMVELEREMSTNLNDQELIEVKACSYKELEVEMIANSSDQEPIVERTTDIIDELVINEVHKLKPMMVFDVEPRRKLRTQGLRKMRTNFTPLPLLFSGNQYDDIVISEDEGGENGDLYSNIKKRHGTRESTRCTRINGKGWRCKRPTQGGHALCDHHLGREETAAMACQYRKPRLYRPKNEKIVGMVATKKFLLKNKKCKLPKYRSVRGLMAATERIETPYEPFDDI